MIQSRKHRTATPPSAVWWVEKNNISPNLFARLDSCGFWHERSLFQSAAVISKVIQNLKINIFPFSTTIAPEGGFYKNLEIRSHFYKANFYSLLESLSFFVFVFAENPPKMSIFKFSI